MTIPIVQISATSQISRHGSLASGWGMIAEEIMRWVDPENGYHSAEIQGRVVDKYTGDQAEKDIDDLAQKYLGQSPYPWRSPGEERVTYIVEPTHVYHQDYS